MAKIQFTAALRVEYQKLFDSCQINPGKAAQVEKLTGGLVSNKPRYTEVGEPLGVPWYVVAVIHNMECSQNFNEHLHNGDALTARTIHVPKGRPTEGDPPFSWEDSASDALVFEGYSQWKDWTIPGMLYKLEGYNGWGYRLYHPEVKSPYLWSASNQYLSGKYVSDGRYAPNIVTPAGTELQKFLNQFPGVFLKEDGKLGRRTSEAYKRIFGRYLIGDPRAR